MIHYNLSDSEWDILPSYTKQKLAVAYLKHAAAPAMYEALQAIEARLQGVFDSPALMRQGMLTHDKSADVIRFVRAALAQAEARS